MTLLRLCLSAIRFHQCRWLERRADQAFWRCIALQVRADRIRNTEHAYLEGLDL